MTPGAPRRPARNAPRWGAALLGLVLAVAAGTARAMPLPAEDRPLQYAVIDQELREVLTGIGNELGLRVAVSQAVRGRVRGRLEPAPPRVMLDRLAALYGFDWYFDGHTLWVTALSEAGTRLLNLGPEQAAALADTLAELGIADPRWPLRMTRGGLVLLSGPPRFMTLAEEAAAALSQRGPAIGVRVFRGSAASPL